MMDVDDGLLSLWIGILTDLTRDAVYYMLYDLYWTLLILYLHKIYTYYIYYSHYYYYCYYAIIDYCIHIYIYK